MNLSSLIDELKPVLRTAGAKILEIYAKDPDADIKGDGSPVTEADKAAEAVILDALARIAPGITVISEENSASHEIASTDLFFLVDPLDGTKEFLKRDGKGGYTVNVALIVDGIPIMGVVYAPALDRMFAGAIGKGAAEENAGRSRDICVRQAPVSGLRAVASASHRDADTNAWLDERGITDLISIGSSLKFCLVAAGEADVYPRFGPTMEWDTAAGDAILRAAGGTVCVPDGDVMMYGKPGYRNSAFIACGTDVLS